MRLQNFNATWKSYYGNNMSRSNALSHLHRHYLSRNENFVCICVCANIYHRLILVFFLMHLREGSNKRSSRSSRCWKKGRKRRRNIFMTLRNFSKNNFAVASIVSLSSSTQCWAATFPFYIYYMKHVDMHEYENCLWRIT